jgi:hypothetical protein
MRFIGAVLAAALIGAIGPERFEVITYTPPPVAWNVLDLGSEGRRYVRQEEAGNGVVVLVPGQPSAGSASDDFAAMWRARAAGVLPGPAPEPTVRRDGEFTVLTGNRKIVAEGQTVTASLVTVVGRGRAMGVVGIATGDAVLREVTAVLASVRVAPVGDAATASAAASAGNGEIGYEIPRGYLERPEPRKIVLLPEIFDARTPCIYGVAAPRRASSSLEEDAESALSEAVVPGWRRQDERKRMQRGTSSTGWPYVWVRGTFQREDAGRALSKIAMATVLPAGGGKVHVVWGEGDPDRCRLHDASFERLFHSLQPGGWTSDGGKALTRDVVGTWRTNESPAQQQLTLGPDGRFERSVATVITAGVGGSGDPARSSGKYVLRGSELLLIPDSNPQRADRYQVRVYESARGTGWKRSMALLDERPSPAVVLWWSRAEAPAR